MTALFRTCLIAETALERTVIRDLDIDKFRIERFFVRILFRDTNFRSRDSIEKHMSGIFRIVTILLIVDPEIQNIRIEYDNTLVCQNFFPLSIIAIVITTQNGDIFGFAKNIENFLCFARIDKRRVFFWLQIERPFDQTIDLVVGIEIGKGLMIYVNVTVPKNIHDLIFFDTCNFQTNIDNFIFAFF
jgi:hypothetical protein